MKIELKQISIREVFDGYKDNNEEGVVAYHGKLNVRPPYQREFVYNDAKRNAVIETVQKNFPLNVMYWVKNPDDTYELLDGQQRTISICQYINNDFSLKYRGWVNLTEEEQEKILNYKLMIYICEGTDKEKLDWFTTINIAGEKLFDQELRNAMYTGAWLHDAKKHFSKNNCPAYGLASKYLSGSAIRQDYLQTALKWIVDRDSLEGIEDYMSKHQHDKDADELWQYFQDVFAWVKKIFPTYRKEMKGLEWGYFYNDFKDKKYNTNELEQKVALLMADDDVQKKPGIYEYLLSGAEKALSIREFSNSQKRTAYEKQSGICPRCGEHFEIEEMEGDHITPWSKGGKTTAENCQMLCKKCNREKSNK